MSRVFYYSLLADESNVNESIKLFYNQANCLTCKATNNKSASIFIPSSKEIYKCTENFDEPSILL